MLAIIIYLFFARMHVNNFFLFQDVFLRTLEWLDLSWVNLTYDENQQAPQKKSIKGGD